MAHNLIELGNYVKILSGFAFKSSLFNENQEGMPLIRIRDVTSGITKTYYNGVYQERYVVKYGDLLITMDGEFKIKKWIGEDALLNQRVCKIESESELLDTEYLLYLMPAILKKIEDRTSFVTVKHLSVKDIQQEIINLPSIDQQRKVVEILNAANELINKRQSQITALDELSKSLFLEMFGDPVINPKNILMKKLGNTGELKRGMSKHRPRNAPELLGGPYPLIQTGDVSKADLFIESYKSTYSELGLKQSKMWEAGTLCITIAANIAETSILKFDACFPDSVVGYKPNNHMNTIFVHYWFGFLQKIIEGNAPESAQKNINLKILNDLEILQPPIGQQVEFANKVLEINKQKTNLLNAKSSMESLYESLLQKAFKGELCQEQ